MARIPIAALILAAACGTRPGGPRSAELPVPRGRALVLAPRGEPALRYNDPPFGAVTSPATHAVGLAAQRAAARVGRPVPSEDARLSAFAVDMAPLLEEERLPLYDAIEFGLAYRGIVEPFPELIMVDAAPDGLEGIAISLEERFLSTLGGTARFGRLGVGAVTLRTGLLRVVVALQESSVVLDPIPRKLSLGEAYRLKGHLLAPFTDPTIYQTGVDGAVVQLPVLREGSSGFRAELSCSGASGRRTVEVLGNGPRGVKVMANFPIWCGEEPPRRLTVPRPSRGMAPVVPSEAEQIIFDLANRDRRRAGLSPLLWDDRAADAARGHSEDMAQEQVVAHVSPRTGTAADRMRAAGVVSALVMENVARAYAPEETQTGFMSSPGHRANILAAEATHMGVGVALGRWVQGQRELYVTQVFFRVPPRLDPGSARQTVAQAVARERAARGADMLDMDQDLEDLAQRLADEISLDPAAEASLTERARARLNRVAGRYETVITLVVVTGDASQITGEALLESGLSHCGIGIAQGTDPRLGERAIFVVILLGRRR